MKRKKNFFIVCGCKRKQLEPERNSNLKDMSFFHGWHTDLPVSFKILAQRLRQVREICLSTGQRIGNFLCPEGTSSKVAKRRSPVQSQMFVPLKGFVIIQSFDLDCILRLSYRRGK